MLSFEVFFLSVYIMIKQSLGSNILSMNVSGIYLRAMYIPQSLLAMCHFLFSLELCKYSHSEAAGENMIRFLNESIPKQDKLHFI